MNLLKFHDAIRLAVFLVLWTSIAGLSFALAPGDVNGDGIVDTSDSAMLLDHLLERKPLQGAALTRADANADGKITMADVAWINNHLQEITIKLPGGVPLALARVPAGTFQMGSPGAERGRDDDEGPTHTVAIGSFYMGKCEVTQKQWLALMGSWPDSTNYPKSTNGLGDNYPAYFISWYDAQNFIKALNAHVAKTGQGLAAFRLPSEAEWEYGCRAGTQTRFFFGDSLSVGDGGTDGPAGTLAGNRSDYMWFWFNCQGNADGAHGSKPAGTKSSNQFRLFDMSGNAWEWCQDWYHTSYDGAPTNGSAWEVQDATNPYRVVRGGVWDYSAHDCRSAARDHGTPNFRCYRFGFRLARNP